MLYRTPAHLTIALCPVIACTASVFRHVNVLRVVEIGKWRVHDGIDDAWFEIQKDGTWYVMLVIGLTIIVQKRTYHDPHKLSMFT